MTPSKYYEGASRFLVSVDCIILQFDKDKIKLLTFRRKIEPYLGGLSLLGGFVYDNENITQAASRVVKELTGLENIYMEQVGAYGNIDRDPGDRVISVAYFALVRLEEGSHDIVEQNEASWAELPQCDELILDHKQMLDDALRMLRQRAAIEPIVFNLLPDRFTLPQMQAIYESIYGVELDKRNFRKKVLAMDILDRLEEKDKSSSKRGAYYFVFNPEKYDKLLQKGSMFTL